MSDKRAPLIWTRKQREIYNLLAAGMRPVDIRRKGYSRSSVDRVVREIANGRKPDGPLPPPPPETKPVEQPRSDPKPAASSSPPHAPSTQKIRFRTQDALEIGGVFIVPEDWHINQYGGLLIVDTYNRAREKYGYEGSVGDFICDACQVLRRVMGAELMPFDYLFKEDTDNDNRETTDEGGTILEESSDDVFAE